MKDKGKGAIINISSLAAYFFAPYLAEYAATKHYMSAFTMAIAEEYANCGVEIQCIEPGAVDTAMTQYFDEVSILKIAKRLSVIILLRTHLEMRIFTYFCNWFQNARGPSYPTPEKYAKSAFRTLGFSRRTNGYVGHSLMNWVLHALFSPTTNNFFV